MVTTKHVIKRGNIAHVRLSRIQINEEKRVVSTKYVVKRRNITRAWLSREEKKQEHEWNLTNVYTRQQRWEGEYNTPSEEETGGQGRGKVKTSHTRKHTRTRHAKEKKTRTARADDDELANSKLPELLPRLVSCVMCGYSKIVFVGRKKAR